MRTIFSFLFLILLSGFSVASADDQVTKELTYSKVSLAVEHRSIAAGSKAFVAFTITPREGWHTYWLNAGDTAFPPRLKWTVPDGVTVGTPQMETPSFIPLPPFASYGYKRASTMLIPIDISANYAKDTITLAVAADWLVCDDICVMENENLSLTVAVGPAKLAPLTGPIFAKARAGQPTVWPASSALNITPNHVRLTMPRDNSLSKGLVDARFFPLTKGLISYIAVQDFKSSATGFTLTIARTKDANALDAVAGLVKLFYRDGRELGFAITPKVSHIPMTILSAETGAPGMPLWQLLIFSLIGGVILNLMPCVFPVLSLKALAFLRASNDPSVHRKEQGLYYTLGILVSFAIIAVILFLLREGGQAAGWGFQLQDPRYVAVIIFIILSVALSLLGLFNISFGVETSGQEMASRDGRQGAFFTGLLATLVATPCTAPFMAPALGFALTQSFWVILPSFLMLGLGLALPFLILSQFPRLATFLPKSGGWMQRVKQALAFPMFLTVAWLLWVFINQTDSATAFLLMAMMIFFSFAIWVFQHTAKKWLRVMSVALMLGSIYASVGVIAAPSTVDETSRVMEGEVYSAERLATLLEAEEPVFLYFTADWCITCKVNETIALERVAVAKLVTENGITILKADWTNRNDHIAAVLQSHGRVGVPLYLWYPKGIRSKQILPEVLTPGTIIDAFSHIE